MQYRRYIISSSFKMAALFATLLSTSIVASVYIYWQVSILLVNNAVVKWAAIVAIASMLLVILISFFISIFVVKRINHIARTAVSIMNTGDLTQRIQLKTGWDDLSNLALVLNHLFEKVDTLMQDIKAVSDNIAHDLRTPLTRLYNYLQTLHQEMAHQQTAYALQEAKNLLNTFHALLRITHLEHGKQKLYRQATALEPLIQDACALYEPVLEKRSIVFDMNIEPINLMLDRDMIFQVMVNILDNAVKHSGKNTQINIMGKRLGCEYRLIFKDYGCGIPKNAHDKIFDRFSQLDTNRSVGGSGLGLSLVRAIVQRHEGRVYSETSDPQGLTIIIVLPINNINYI